MNLKLREYREARGLTQQAMGAELKKSFRTIQSWERGESYPNAEALWNMCEFFGTDPNEILGWYDEHPGDRPSSATSREESALLDNYRAAPAEGRSTITAVAQMACGQEPPGTSSDEAEAV